VLRSIRAQIAIPYVLLILVATAGLAAYFANVARQTYMSDLEQQLAGEAQLVAADLAPLFAQGAPPGQIEDRVRRLGELIQVRVTVIAPNGVVVGDSADNPEIMENHLARPEVKVALAGGVGVDTHTSHTLGYPMMYVAAPVSLDAGPIVGVARVALPLTQIQERLSRLRYTVLGASLVSAVLAGLLALWIAGRLTRPIRHLTGLAEDMAHGELGGQIQVSRRDEIGRLAGAFNRMSSELETHVAALDNQRTTLTTVLAHMVDGVLIVDEKGQIELLNPAAARLLDVTQEAAVGQRFAALVRDHQVVEIWRRCADGGDELADTVDLGRNRPFLRVVTTPLRNTADRACLILLQDLTQIRRLETVRRDFISNISHELRTPLAALKALVDTLRDGALDDPPAAERFLDRMDLEVDTLTQIVEELLELSRIESGQVPLRLVPSSPAELIGPPVERLQPQAERSHVSVLVALPPDPASKLPLVLADRDRARAVVTNLLHNAIKFTPPGGNVTITATSGDPDEQGDGEVMFSIRDTGIGIPADDLSRIFERFYKADRARSGGGTGLGLAIARHIVQGHGGRIWAESVEGEGSTFYFTLPSAKEEAP
jgi:two-component system phosphate regulon sensor histidine kinase PhoR